MSLAIGLRFYKISVRRKSDRTRDVTADELPCDLHSFATDFIAKHREATVEEVVPRTWFFDPTETLVERMCHGFINYGTHGFESKFKDVKTRRERYQRLSTDLEEIPLYYQIWSLESSRFALMAFQSFGGRSCVSLIRSSMMIEFQKLHPNYLLFFHSLTQAAAIHDEAPVKVLTFYQPKPRKDRADSVLLGKRIDELDYELNVRAKGRTAFITTYGDLRQRLPSKGVVAFDGQDFESVKADVKVGNKRRTIGVFGSGADAGSIDISDEVERGPDGHPVFQAIASIVDDLMDEYADGLQ